MDLNKEIKQLEILIIKNSEAYYSGRNCIPDEVFDHYVKRLAQLDPENEVIKSTGWGMKVQSTKKRPHRYGKVIGIPDKPKPEIVNKRIKNLGMEYKTAYISTKLDGCSILLYYKDGKLEEVLTRGDGDTGENVTDRISIMVPTVIDKTFTGRIRGEFIIDKDTWNRKYAENNKSARNYAAGLLNRDTFDEEEITDFRLICYKALDINNPMNFEEQQNFLENMGFYTVPYLKVDKIDSNLLSTKESCNKLLSDLNQDVFECDGLVVNCDDIEFAVKWNEEGVETKVIDIKYQPSRLGKLTPVIYIEPVELSGATINKLSGFNYQFIVDNGVGVGSIIKVVRSGDVIPYITDIITNSRDNKIPEKCPVCGGELSIEGVNLICKNENCDSRGKGTLLYFIQTVTPVDGLGEKLLQILFTHFKINNVLQFIHFANTYDRLQLMRFCNITKGLGKSAFIKFKELLDKYRNESLNLVKIITGLGLPSLGEKSVKKILDIYSYQDLINALKDNTISSIPGVNYIAVQSLYLNYEYIENVVNSLRNIPFCLLKRDIKDNIIDIGKICITGPLSVSRKEFLDLCSDIGIEESSIAKADVLVTNTPNSNTNKNKEAIKRGIKVMSEKEFREKYLNI